MANALGRVYTKTVGTSWCIHVHPNIQIPTHLRSTYRDNLWDVLLKLVRELSYHVTVMRCRYVLESCTDDTWVIIVDIGVAAADEAPDTLYTIQSLIKRATNMVEAEVRKVL